MSSRVEEFAPGTLPAPFRWLGAAAAVVTAIAVVRNLRERARRPRLAPMSDEWLQRHAADREYHTYD